MMKSSEVSEEELNLARIKMESSNPQSSNVEQNDIMTQERVLKFKHLTYEAAMLSQLRGWFFIIKSKCSVNRQPLHSLIIFKGTIEYVRLTANTYVCIMNLPYNHRQNCLNLYYIIY